MMEMVADEYRRLIEVEIVKVMNLRAAKRKKLLDVQVERVEIEASLVRLSTVDQSSDTRSEAFDAAFPLAEKARKLKENEKALTLWIQMVNQKIKEEFDRIESTYGDEISELRNNLTKKLAEKMGLAREMKAK